MGRVPYPAPPPMNSSSILALFGAALLATPVAAQSNVIPGTDVSLGILSDLTMVGRQGNYPAGMNALAMATTSCNKGSVDVPWLAPMQENHPMMAFMVVRYDPGGRIMQVSDYSAVKHGFFALANSQCDSCTVNPFGHNGLFLGVGCSDTYSVSNNSNNYYLAPAEEIDPWLGEWEATCSFFDAGTNPTPQTECDGVRSFSSSQANNLGPLGQRVRVPDAALIPGPGTQFAYGSYYVIRGEPEARRGNNLGYRTFNPSWTGSNWNFIPTGNLTYASVLELWPGARLESATNGNDDGRVFVSSHVTGPDAQGVYHYEFAVHNRDNFRGVGELRIPLCASADATGFGFRDVDLDVGNNWSFTRVGDELVVSTGNNPLRWNSIYNFWFDSTAAPTDGAVSLGQFFPGAGAASFNVAGDVPGTVFDYDLGPGCAASGVPPTIAANGQATLGNSGFRIEAGGFGLNFPSVVLFASTQSAALPIGQGCVLYLGGALGPQVIQVSSGIAGSGGEFSFPAPIPANTALEGVDLAFQAISIDLVGPAFGLGELSNGLLVRVGNQVSGCGQ